MPRRHNRPAPPPVEDVESITVQTAPPPPEPRRWLPQREWEAERDRRDRERDERRERRQKAATNAAIDWVNCIVPQCPATPITVPWYTQKMMGPRDADVQLPICLSHAVVVWSQVQQAKALPDTIETVEAFREREAERLERNAANAKARFLAQTHGEVYYVRVGKLIKVGWTRCFYDRLRAYGPGAEVLCHYPASRNDETVLHRQLTPAHAGTRQGERVVPRLQDRPRLRSGGCCEVRTTSDHGVRLDKPEGDSRGQAQQRCRLGREVPAWSPPRA